MAKRSNPAYFETEFSNNIEFESSLSGNNVYTFNTSLNETTIINKDHKVLKNRDLEDQHPIKAISGLQAALDSKQDSLIADEYSGIVIENNHIRLDDLILDCGTSTTVI